MSTNKKNKRERKLTPAEVKAMRDIYRLNPKATYRKLEQQFGVSKTLIARIIKGELYKDVQ